MDLQVSGAAIGVMAMAVFWLLLALIPALLGVMYGLMQRRKGTRVRLARAQIGRAGYVGITAESAPQTLPTDRCGFLAEVERLRDHLLIAAV